MTYVNDYTARGTLGCSGCGVGLGDTSDPVAALVAQVNRFGPSAPATYRYVSTTYPVATGTVPAAVAVSAAFLLLRRAQDAVVRYGDTASAALMQKALAATANPQAYVQANLQAVTVEIAAFADTLGIPASGGLGTIAGIPITTVVAGIGGALALGWVLLGRKKRR